MTDDLFNYFKSTEAGKQEEARDEIEKLRKDLRHHNQLYYQDAEPEISDAQYDELYRRLEELEKQYPRYDDPESPTHRVGGAPLEEFAQIRHQVQMLSIDDIFEQKEETLPPGVPVDIELINFYEKLGKALGESDIPVTIEPKIDGVAVTLMYQSGKLTYAATRGDGIVGDDITANVRTIKAIPLTLPPGHPETLEIRGEIFMPNTAFAKLNEARDMEGLPAFANPRNATAGTLKLLDSRQVAARPLTFLGHGIGAYQGEELESVDQFWNLLNTMGIPANNPVMYASTLEEVRNCVREIDRLRKTFDYGTDGAVIKIQDFATRNSLGATARAPRWAAAYKFPPEQKETTLNAITIQVGRTGVLTPVAELTPVLLSGSTVSRATLHNQDEISRKDIRVGDTVLVEKAGEIIPAVIKVNLEVRPANSVPYNLFDAVGGCCPACGEAISKQDGMVAWRCTNFTCPAQAVSRITHFCSRPALDIESIGSSVAEALVARGMAHSPLDLFRLNAPEFGKLNLGTPEEPRRYGEKNAVKAIEALTASKNLPLERWLISFGIPQVGEVVAKVLANTHPDLDALTNSPFLQDLVRLDELNSSAKLKNPNNRDNKKAIKEHPEKKEAIEAEFRQLVDEIAEISRPWLDRGYIRELRNKQGGVPSYGSDIGPAAARTTLQFFSSPAGKNLLKDLHDLGIFPQSENYRENLSGSSDGPLGGKTFVVTGSLSQPRPDIKKLIEQNGGHCAAAISKTTDYLVAGEGGGSKRDKAAKLNVPVISEEQLLNMIHNQD